MNIPLFKQFPQLLEDPNLFKQVLLPNDYWCLKNAVTKIHPLSTRQYYVFKLLEYWKIYKDIHKHKKGAKPLPLLKGSITERSRFMEKAMRKEKIPFPSYANILNSLNNLSEQGILVKMNTKNDDGSTKQIDYWVLSPNFTTEYKKWKEI